jgi:hypothetical protein
LAGFVSVDDAGEEDLEGYLFWEEERFLQVVTKM